MSALVYLLVACGLNIGLDILFVAKFQMGVNGAAWATILAQGISAVLCFYKLLHMKNFFELKKSHVCWKKKYVTEIVEMGVPSGLTQVIMSMSMLAVQSLTNSFGETVIAANVIVARVDGFATMPARSFGTARTTYAGQNVGAGKPGRVRQGTKCCMLLGSGYALLALLLFYLFGGSLATLFADPANGDLIHQIHVFLICNSLFFIPLTGVNVLRFCIQGMGHSQIAILAGIFEMAARSIVGFVFVHLLGFSAACFANPAAWVAANCFLIPAYLHFSRCPLEPVVRRKSPCVND